MDEVENMMLVGTPAWHEKGTVWSEPPKDVGVIYDSGGLEFQVLESPAYRLDDVPIAGYKVLYRSDNMANLAIVSEEYRVFQNEDEKPRTQRFIDSGHLDIETAGVLRQGKRCFTLFKVKDSLLEVGKGDPVELYLLRAWGHDGMFGHHTQFTAVRVVCMNTMRAALNDGNAHIRFAHKSGIHEAVSDITDIVLKGKARFEEVVEAYKAFTKKPCNPAEFEAYVKTVLQVPPKQKELPRAYKELWNNFCNGPGADLPGARGTMWGAYNAFTDWIDHSRGKEENRLNSTWFGEGAMIRQRAFDTALAA